ncbi:peptide-methionine (R)-S-oxide reductase MsrB [Rhizobiales bacterium L72]|uniref:peptide-methionine (R)-S-oxide reductase n=2 Tax=Propylenella binzhouense TaxID=2555902 RepID=A0A964T2D7_9HYPH|nr:peptide-methionine (R)-S-oxide reductase MsrB [Propylenella binzhouense]MYZ47213.1 peptide-methionine (R)-S-oxide reductase MsrB [Propylenella binzhouense]
MSKRLFLGAGLAGLGAAAAGLIGRGRIADSASAETFEIARSDAEWKRLLTPEQYYVLREEGTERAGTSPLNNEKRAGIFHCAGCDLPVYSSKTKYESGTGWPSFWESLPNAIGTKEDNSFFMRRTEVHCRRCGGHFGHIFDDGPPPTGKRHCLNGVALRFAPGEAEPAST